MRFPTALEILAAGPPVEFLLREAEVGKRVAIYQSNEDEGWGPWIDTSRMFDLDYPAIETMAEWGPNPHTGEVPIRPTRKKVPYQRSPHPLE